MSELIVIGYEDVATARQAYEQVLNLQKDFVVRLQGLAIVNVDDEGKTHVDTPQPIVGVSAATGAMWGLLFGVLFLVPGMAIVGGAIGALFGVLNRSGVNDRFRTQVHDLLTPGHSAVVIMAAKVTEDRMWALWIALPTRAGRSRVVMTTLTSGSSNDTPNSP